MVYWKGDGKSGSGVKKHACEIGIWPLPELIVLYQHQFPGFDNVQWLCKKLSLGEAG